MSERGGGESIMSVETKSSLIPSGELRDKQRYLQNVKNKDQTHVRLLLSYTGY